MNLAVTVIEKSSSFDWRGPYQSLTRVDGDKIDVIRSTNDWSVVAGGKPVNDQRNGNLADLFPRPRAVLARVFAEFEQGTSPKKIIGPGL